MSTRLASSRSIAFSPNALTSVVMFFLVSGRDMARMAGLRGFFRNLKISCAPACFCPISRHRAVPHVNSPSCQR